MKIVGILLLVVGLLGGALLFSGVAPDVLTHLPIPMPGWVGMIVVGGVLLFLTRRPAD